MIEIQEIDKNTSNQYFQDLNLLINTTLNLPQDSIDYFSNQWNQSKIDNQISKYLFLRAKNENGETLGLVLGTPTEGGVGTIVWLLVNKKFQNQKVGSELFKEAVNWYKERNAHKLKLTVPEESTTKFYIKQGMMIEGEHKNHWWKNDYWTMGLFI